MADYQDIRGLRVKYLSADPSVTVGGEVWYNSTTGTLRSRLVSSAWSSSSPLTTARNGGGGFGIQTAGVFAGGYVSPAPYSNATEEYNGSGWSAGGDIGTAREAMAGGAGTLTAGLIAGGYLPAPTSANTDATEEYDGSSWTAGGVLGTPRRYTDVIGTQTAALACGGFLPPGTNATEEYGGTSWTAGGNMNVTSHNRAGAGTQSAAWIAGKEPTGGETELYDGSSWTAVNALNTGRQAASASGITTAGLYFGGNSPSPSTNVLTEEWDGTDWSVAGALGTAIANAGSATQGTISASLAMGGTYPTGVTQEFNKASTVITPGVWASSGTLPTVIFRGASFGTLTAGANTGGDNTSAQPSVTTTSEYDGSTWTVGGVLATARRGLAASGTQASGLAFGGSDGSSDANVTGVTEEYGGTSWTTSPGSLNTARSAISGDGTQTASIAAGGYLGPPTANSDSAETYNGATWTAITSIPSVRRWPTTSGTTTAALTSGGETAPGTQLTIVSEWDGSSWTEGGALLVTTSAGASAGTQTDALYFAGRNPSYTGAASGYDGTAWSTRPAMATARSMVGGSGVSTSAFVCGGETTPALVDLTEEFAGATSAANIETLTTS